MHRIEGLVHRESCVNERLLVSLAWAALREQWVVEIRAERVVVCCEEQTLGMQSFGVENDAGFRRSSEIQWWHRTSSNVIIVM